MPLSALLILTVLVQQARVYPLPEDGDGLTVRLWLDKGGLHTMPYDPLFVRVTVANQSGEELQVGADMCQRARFTISRGPFQYTFASDVNGLGGTEPLRMQPGDEWIVDYGILQIPPVEIYDHSFWRDIAGSNVDIEAHVRSRHVAHDLLSHGLAGRGFVVRPRPQAEMVFLEALYAEQARRKRENVSYQDLGQERDLYRPSPGSFGLHGFVPFEDLIEKLLDYEENLSPGTLRDIVHMTRLTRRVYDEADPAKKQAAVDELLGFLDSLPRIEQEIMLFQVFNGWPHFSDEPAYLRLIDGVLKRMPKEVYQYDDYPAYRLRGISGDNPALVQYVEQHAGTDDGARRNPLAEREQDPESGR